ncbi:MAG TPA: hydrogenase maturation protease [Thermoanaerobaculia bacterium]|jgi:hydrogenase maturation protease|nr:hydrogenase maturation protease [Thermoanaerobaculia bacterium]
MKIAVFGIGNVLAHDDAVGPSVARILDAGYSFPDNVVIEDLGTPALELPTHLAGFDHVILIDAVAAAAETGAIRLYRRDDILRNPPGLRISPHDPSLKETLLMLDLLGQAPDDIVLVGIVVKEASMGIGISPEVEAAFPLATRAVIAELENLGVIVNRREEPKPADLWWAA